MKSARRDMAMTWYRSIEDVIDTNILTLDLTRDHHPHRLLRSRDAIQSVIERVREVENRGLSYQAAQLMRDIAMLHAFAGANHRTAYIVAKMFLRRNGKRLSVDRLEDAYAFIKDLENKTIEQIRG